MRTLAELVGALRELGEDESVAQYRWLRCLAEFDRRQGWAADGALSCVDWLTDRCGLARTSAYERLRVARELVERPVIEQAFAVGKLRWCQVRAITRLTGADAEVDEALLGVAREGTVADLEAAVRHWRLLREQDEPPPNQRIAQRGEVRVRREGPGLSRIDLVLADADLIELLSDVDGVVLAESDGDPQEATRLAKGRAASLASTEKHEMQDVDSFPHENSTAAGSEELTFGQRRADALVELVRTGRAHLGVPTATAAERRTVNVVVDYDRLVGTGPGHAELLGGTPVSGATLRRLACDAGVVRHVVRGRSEVLDVGRKTKVWTGAQRRALLAVFGGRCCFSGCWRSLLELHHLEHWTLGGPTDLANGAPLCWAHHVRREAPSNPAGGRSPPGVCRSRPLKLGAA